MMRTTSWCVSAAVARAPIRTATALSSHAACGNAPRFPARTLMFFKGAASSLSVSAAATSSEPASLIASGEALTPNLAHPLLGPRMILARTPGRFRRQHSHHQPPCCGREARSGRN